MKDKSFTALIVLIAGLIILAIVFLGYFIVRGQPNSKEQILGGQSGPQRDIIGTRVGTSTTPGNYFSAGGVQSPTTTARKLLLQNTDSALFTLKFIAASTTAQGGSKFVWHILGSNDNDCDVIATSTTDDNYDAAKPLVDDINWFDIGQAVDPTGWDNTMITDSSAIPTTYATGTSFIIKDVNWNCFRVDSTGSSTRVWMQIKEKILTP